jgi:hypothetical protein
VQYRGRNSTSRITIGVVNLGHGPEVEVATILQKQKAKFVSNLNNAAAAARIPDGHVRKLLASACADICHVSGIVRSGCSWARGWEIRLLSTHSRPFPPQVERAGERVRERERERARTSNDANCMRLPHPVTYTRKRTNTQAQIARV